LTRTKKFTNREAIKKIVLWFFFTNYPKLRTIRFARILSTRHGRILPSLLLP